ncbi:rho GTPase-activating protein 27 [Eudromia elegans]
MAAAPAEPVHVLVEHGFEYRAKDGTLVSIKPNERYVLLRRTNRHWWHVRRSGDARPFYIPAQYVKELPPMAAPAPRHWPPVTAVVTGQSPAYEYRFISAAEAGPTEGPWSPRPATLEQPPSEHTDHEGSPGAARPRESREGERGGGERPPERESAGACPGRREPEQPPEREPPPEPVYLNLEELREEAAAAEAHTDPGSGRVFYYNPLTGASSWECPMEEAEDGVSAGASPAARGAEAAAAWRRYVDDATGQAFFHNPVTGETSWDPPWPDVSAGVARPGAAEQRPPTPETDYPELSPDELDTGADSSSPGSCEGAAWPWPWRAEPPGCCTPDTWRSLEKAGVLNCTRTADRGRRLRKSWSSSWTVLEGGILTFFRDSKHSSAGALRQPSTLSTPEHTVELRGATAAWAGKDKSSKRNVLELRTREGSEFLLQHDSEQIIGTWHRAIADSIARLSADLSLEDDVENGAEFGSREKLAEEKRPLAPGQATGSSGGESDSSKVRHKLRRFLQRRPTLQALRERGYIRDQVFGCSLGALCERERGTVPRFVLQCIRTVERRGLDVDGLYRVSGNLATIQKLRYKVDHDEHLDLEDGRWEDIHVVTGALKLFFRELPEPLVPFAHFDQFIAAIKLPEPARRGRRVRELVRALPPAHHDTMRLLFQHLCRVVEHKEENRMSVQSVAIVFGPTLLRPACEQGNMAVHMVFQNQVVELILNQYGSIFPHG